MPNLGRKSGGPGKAVSGSKAGGNSRGFTPKGGRGISQKRDKRDIASESEDTPLDPNVPYETDQGGRNRISAYVEKVEPFSDGLVSLKLRDLAVIPRIGGEEVALLRDFLSLFAKTETFIGAIASKTSFMKKTGGRLL